MQHLKPQTFWLGSKCESYKSKMNRTKVLSPSLYDFEFEFPDVMSCTECVRQLRWPFYPYFWKENYLLQRKYRISNKILMFFRSYLLYLTYQTFLSETFIGWCCKLKEYNKRLCHNWLVCRASFDQKENEAVAKYNVLVQHCVGFAPLSAAWSSDSFSIFVRLVGGRNKTSSSTEREFWDEPVIFINIFNHQLALSLACCSKLLFPFSSFVLWLRNV